MDNLPLQAGQRKLSRAYTSDVIEDVKSKVLEWRENPTFGIAADLLNFSHIPEARELLEEPAKFITDNVTNLSPQLSATANKILGSSVYKEYGSGSIHRKEIIKLKKLLALNPRNAIALVDMARIYVIQGQRSQAERAIRTAVALQPDNRFVLRSSSRFYIHDGDPERALAILKKSYRTQEDPWLLASMIAIETIQDKSPLYFKRARTMMENTKYNPVHLAELGAALATLHLNTGQYKLARRLFTDSLDNPNDNAVAQAVWASNEFSMPINIQPDWLSDRFSSEANYYTREKSGDYEQALKAAQNWFEDEPFSLRPLQAGSFVASILGMYDVAEDLVHQALTIDPGCIDSKNNLVFALAGQGKIREAVELLNEVYTTEARKESGVSGHTLANRGMLYYRTGDQERGRENYKYATMVFEKNKQLPSKAIAMAYWIQEATLAQDPGLPQLLSIARECVDSSDSTAAKIVLARATNTAPPNGEVGKRIYNTGLIWEHDKSKNLLIVSKKSPFGL